MVSGDRMKKQRPKIGMRKETQGDLTMATTLKNVKREVE